MLPSAAAADGDDDARSYVSALRPRSLCENPDFSSLVNFHNLLASELRFPEASQYDPRVAAGHAAVTADQVRVQNMEVSTD